MSDALSFAEIDGQRVELLPARTVLSLYSAEGAGSNSGGGIFGWLSGALPNQVNSAGNGSAGTGGSAYGGSGGVLGS
ncbi:MAG TPA: hypothetical protein VFO16_08620 [Pseudonocardiaceae bacterium]|nr:hypothetical protein [Pseudonocardiaceae bacterium]